MDKFVLVRAISSMLLPPLGLYLLAALGSVLALLGRKRAGAVLVALSMLALVVLSTPPVAAAMIKQLTADVPVLAKPRQTQAQAIVILGGGRYANAAEYGGSDQPGSYTLRRLRYGAWLHAQTGLPILVTGGSPEGRAESEASLMAHSLRQDFKTPVRWIEGRSDNTEQNARYSAAMLKEAGIQRIVLVSDDWHLPRALRTFADQGLQVAAAPTKGLDIMQTQTFLDWLPDAHALSLSHHALHEWLGMLWYSLRH